MTLALVAAAIATTLVLAARGAQAEQDEDGAEGHVEEGKVPLERALGDLVRQAVVVVGAAPPAASASSVERAQTAEAVAPACPPASWALRNPCRAVAAAAALAFLVVVVVVARGECRGGGGAEAATAGAAAMMTTMTMMVMKICGAGPGVKQWDARLGRGQGDKEEGGRGERGEAEHGDEEGRRAEEGEDVGDGGEDGDGEEG